MAEMSSGFPVLVIPLSAFSTYIEYSAFLTCFALFSEFFMFLTLRKQEAAGKEEELQEVREKAGQLKRRVTELEEEQRETQKVLQTKVTPASVLYLRAFFQVLIF